MTNAKAICDFFHDSGGVEYVVEIYQVDDGYVEYIGLYPLNEDGSKGASVDPDDFDGLLEKAQKRYCDWVDSHDQ